MIGQSRLFITCLILRATNGSGIVEAGERLVGAVAGHEVPAVGEDWGVALVGGLIVILLEPPEQGAGVRQELVVEGVLSGGRWKVGPLVEGAVVVALPGELFEFFVGEAVFGADVFGF